VQAGVVVALGTKYLTNGQEQLFQTMIEKFNHIGQMKAYETTAQGGAAKIKLFNMRFTDTDHM